MAVTWDDQPGESQVERGERTGRRQAPQVFAARDEPAKRRTPDQAWRVILSERSSRRIAFTIRDPTSSRRHSLAGRAIHRRWRASG
jgi:hypothetical protein